MISNLPGMTSPFLDPKRSYICPISPPRPSDDLALYGFCILSVQAGADIGRCRFIPTFKTEWQLRTHLRKRPEGIDPVAPKIFQMARVVPLVEKHRTRGLGATIAREE